MADEQHGLPWDYNNGGLDPGEPTSINTISRAFLSTVTLCTVGLTLGLGPNIRDSGAKPPRILLPNLCSDTLPLYLEYISSRLTEMLLNGEARKGREIGKEEIKFVQTNGRWNLRKRKEKVKLLLDESMEWNFF